MQNDKFDLLSTVEYGGCSAKLSPEKLGEILKDIPLLKDPRIMVDIETHDDAGVYKLNDETALIVTTDFFPPVCSDAFTFGEIAAANSLSDVYAMGGNPILCLNLNMFPSTKIPLEVLGEIIKGGQAVVNSSGAFTMGGHTIDDYPPKYGLAVVGVVHPDKLMTNAGAKAGQKLILTKPLGLGVVIAAQRMDMVSQKVYQEALEQMKTLNKLGMEVMQRYGVKGATDITGFGLIGHAAKMAQASGVTFEVALQDLPVLPEVVDLLEEGCIPGAAFRNQKYVADIVEFAEGVNSELKMLACDAQTSGGLLFAVDAAYADAALKDLLDSGIHPYAKIIGDVKDFNDKNLKFR